ncbi:hypothetical protein DL96DRAFT_909981 [Flagelloscypha sp. PMI_526]|nr:hypothetical protein DL96DRAFT_909981 [Flagelloscypha sp. PMI_526]
MYKTCLFLAILHAMTLLGLVFGGDAADAELRGITVNGFTDTKCGTYFKPWYTDAVPFGVSQCCTACTLTSFSVTASLRIPSSCYLYLYISGDCSGNALNSVGPITDGWTSACLLSPTAHSAKISCGAT